jgi:hypothetical protein
VAEVVPEPVRVHGHPGLPGAGAQVAVEAAGGLVADFDGPGCAALAADPDLAALQV